mgnify:FL=1
MTILHMLKSEPDSTVIELIRELRDDSRVSVVELYSGDTDWEKLVENIFSHEKTICWW